MGLPVITTNVFHFSKIIEDKRAGLVIPYGVKDFIKATDDIMNNYRSHQRNALTLAKSYYYKKIYPLLFTDTTG
jgi:glycosyltransferase involved in cell wall biosynthesis